jgi:GNAT superfamily N-acetyltransferase
MVAVTATAAGQGVGRALTVAAERWAGGEGLRLMVLEVCGGNQGAQGFCLAPRLPGAGAQAGQGHRHHNARVTCVSRPAASGLRQV